MNELLNLTETKTREHELRHSAEMQRQVRDSERVQEAEAGRGHLAIRHARPLDGPALRRLAQLDSARLQQPSDMLVAELDGELIAALPIDAGHAIADPFQPTAAAVELLHQRLTELRSSAPRRGRLRRMWSALRRTGPELAPR